MSPPGITVREDRCQKTRYAEKSQRSRDDRFPMSPPGGHVRNDGCPKNLVPQENQSRGFSGVTAEIRMTLCSPQSWFPLISVQTCLNEERHVQNVDFLFGVNSGVSTGRPDGGYRLYIRI